MGFSFLKGGIIALNLIAAAVSAFFIKIGQTSPVPGNHSDANRNAVSDDKLKWPCGIVPYIIDSSLDDVKPLILKAMGEFHTKIRFIPRSPKDLNYVKLISDKRCYSPVGMQGTGQQVLSLGGKRCNKLNIEESCKTYGRIVHTLCHVIGFYHEHRRSDRDKYIEIKWENILPGHEEAFKKMAPGQNRIYNGFDIDSVVMHGPFEFSKNLVDPVIVDKRGRTLISVDEKKGLSVSDVERINMLYS